MNMAPRLLTHEQLDQLLTFRHAIEAVESVSMLEYKQQVKMPVRMNSDLPTGWFRVMPAAIHGDDDWNVMGLKVMNLIKGVGLRYMILLFSGKTGELLAVMDAAKITQMRTGGATAVAAKYMSGKNIKRIGVIGSGFEARGQLLAVNEVITFKTVFVFSPNPENRKRYADEMQKVLGKEVRPVDSAEEAVRDSEILILATKTDRPVIDGDWIPSGCTVLSIGSTRLDLRELDDRSFARASKLLVDHKEQVCQESADVRSALDKQLFSKDNIIEMKDVVGKQQHLRQSNTEILIYKSVGTALQDIALAKIAYQTAVEQNIGQSLGPFPYLKGF
jgi:ornithine cyclodeaminase/alanine dehydrogenase-like protein (mu-crystallin family)